MKKIKKLILKKEIIANLSEDAMKSIKGGATFICTFETCSCNFTCGGYGGGGGGGNKSDDCPHTQPPRCCEYGCCETTNC